MHQDIGRRTGLHGDVAERRQQHVQLAAAVWDVFHSLVLLEPKDKCLHSLIGSVTATGGPHARHLTQDRTTSLKRSTEAALPTSSTSATLPSTLASSASADTTASDRRSVDAVQTARIDDKPKPNLAPFRPSEKNDLH